MASDVRCVKSERKVKKLKVRVTDLESSISSWEQRLMEIDQQHQNMFSQYNKKICKLTTELETVRSKLKSSNRKIKELEEKLEAQDRIAETSAPEVPNSSEYLPEEEDENQENENRIEVLEETIEEVNKFSEVNEDEGWMNTEMLKAAGTILEPSPEPPTDSGTSKRTSTRLREKSLRSSSEESGGISPGDTESFETVGNGTLDRSSMSVSDVEVCINPDALYLDSSFPEEEEISSFYVRDNETEESKPFACQNCLNIFEGKEDLDNHLSCCNDFPFKCHLCPQKFGLDVGLDAHLEKSHAVNTIGEIKTRRPKCEICKETFGSNWAIKKHTENVHGKGKERAFYSCSHCERRFLRKDTLSAHMIYIHKGGKPFSCSICSKGFTRRDSLRKHYCVAGEEGFLKCPKCSKRFPTWKQISGHMAIHRKKPWLGLKERAAAAGPEKILKMIQISKENKRNTTCFICNLKYAHCKSLGRHVKKNHPEIWEEIAVPSVLPSQQG